MVVHNGSLKGELFVLTFNSNISFLFRVFVLSNGDHKRVFLVEVTIFLIVEVNIGEREKTSVTVGPKKETTPFKIIK